METKLDSLLYNQLEPLKNIKGSIALTDIKDVDLVEAIQLALVFTNYLPNRNEVDGIVGAKTLRAFKEFKRERWLAKPTIIGNGSGRTLRNDALSQLNTSISKDALTSLDTSIVDISKIPSTWKNTKDIHTLVRLLFTAFEDLKKSNTDKARAKDYDLITSNVLAFAAATICLESSWNPKAMNTTDRAANTGYAGRGLAQITWHFNYKAVSEITGIDFVNNPEYMFEPEKALKAKGAFLIMNKLVPLLNSNLILEAATFYNTGRKKPYNRYAYRVQAEMLTWMDVFKA